MSENKALLKTNAESPSDIVMIVKDSKTGKDVSITRQMQLEAKEIDDAIQGDIVLMSYRLFLMKRKKAHQALGFSTWTSYCDARHISPRQVRRYLRIGVVFGQHYYTEKRGKIVSLNKKNILAQAEGEEIDSQNRSLTSGFDTLSVGKLDVIASLPTEEVQQFLNEGFIENPTTKEVITAEDFNGMIDREAERRISEFKRALRKETGSERAKLSEENKKLKQEAKIVTKKNAELEESQKLARELELKYGPKASDIRSQNEALISARQDLENFKRHIHTANLSEETGDSLLREFLEIYEEAILVLSRVRHNHLDIFIDFQNANDLSPIITESMRLTIDRALEMKAKEPMIVNGVNIDDKIKEAVEEEEAEEQAALDRRKQKMALANSNKDNMKQSTENE